MSDAGQQGSGVGMMPSRRAMIGGLGCGLLIGPSAAVAEALKATQPLTMGPFYPLAKPDDRDMDLTLVRGHSRHAVGQVIEVIGQITDPKGIAVPNARIEVWQANAAGRYLHPSDRNTAPIDPDFQGYASFRAGADGRYRFVTVKPGAYPSPRGVRTPHIHLDIDGRVDRLVTQMFFPREPLNASDFVMRDLEDPAVCIATANGRSAANIERFTWDIVLNSG